MDFQSDYELGDLYARHAVDEHPDDRTFFMHIHERCEFFYFVSGKAEYLVEGARYPLEPGDLMIMSPLESHRTRILEDRRYERYVLNFSVSAVEKIDPEHRLLKPFFDRPAGRGNLYRPSELPGVPLAQNFCAMCGERLDDYERRIKITACLYFFLEQLGEAYTKRGAAEYQPPESLAEQMVAYVNAHLYSELSVPLLAEQFLLSVSQFGKIFKQATGAAPWEYITIKRLNAAREKMRAGTAAQRAGESCGFRDYSTFYRAYVKYFGCAPKDDMR
ncbi:MAG: AraC family transcriptional regulator [Lachnospiraceae bacterium]|nr:AraC family transcriptional regulator [Lachnospiraceae bacterium]